VWRGVSVFALRSVPSGRAPVASLPKWRTLDVCWLGASMACHAERNGPRVGVQALVLTLNCLRADQRQIGLPARGHWPPSASGRSSQRQAQPHRRKPVVQLLAEATTGRTGRPTGCGRIKPETGPDSAPETCRSGARRGRDWASEATDRLWPGPGSHEWLLRRR
jgi:hypothetical protein